MASNLPIDFSHPAVKEYVALIRLQVLTPLSTLVHIATVLATQFVVSPTLSEITKQRHRTSITPQPSLVGVFLIILWALQLGYTFLLVGAWREDTKKSFVHGTGKSFVFANWLMAAYAIALSTTSFVVATVFISLTVLFLIIVNIRLVWWYPAYWTHPLDYLFIHAPARLFLLLTLTLLLPLTVFMEMGHDWELPKYDESYPWEGFAAVTAAGILAVIVVAVRQDVIWGLGTMWILWSIGGMKAKSSQVMTSIVVFTIAIPLAFIASLIWIALRKQRRHGQIRLEEGETPNVHSHAAASPPPAGGAATARGNHEVGDDVWG